MKITLKQIILTSMSIYTFAQGAESAISAQEVLITNATNMPIVVRAMRRTSQDQSGINVKHWKCIDANDQAFNRSNTSFTLQERQSMANPFTLNPGESKRLLWIESWKFDLLFAPSGSDLAERMAQSRCSISKSQVASNLHQGNWGNMYGGTRVVIYLLSSEAAKRHLAHNESTRGLIGKKAAQDNLTVGKLNLAIIREVDQKLTPTQAANKQENLINVFRTEIE